MTPEQHQNERKAQCRADTLAHLANRDRVAHRAPAVRERVNREKSMDFSPEEIVSALDFLVGLGDASKTRERLGSEWFYQVTPQGMLNYERGQG